MEFIEETLMEKYNALLKWGIFPDSLRTAKVTSLHEKGDEKYPQLSSSSFLNVGKFTEYQINFLHKKEINRISNDSTQGKSTETAIHDFLESVQNAREKKIKHD